MFQMYSVTLSMHINSMELIHRGGLVLFFFSLGLSLASWSGPENFEILVLLACVYAYVCIALKSRSFFIYLDFKLSLLGPTSVT